MEINLWQINNTSFQKQCYSVSGAFKLTLWAPTQTKVCQLCQLCLHNLGDVNRKYNVAMDSGSKGCLILFAYIC